MRSMLGLTQVSYVEHKRSLAVVDSRLEQPYGVSVVRGGGTTETRVQ